MFVDACAMVSILSSEPDAAAYAEAIAQSASLTTSATAAWEAIVVLSRETKLDRPLLEVENFLCDWLAGNKIELEGPRATERKILSLAIHALATYGGGSNKINALDCFHYAHAKAAGSPMLTRDRLLRATDLSTLP